MGDEEAAMNGAGATGVGGSGATGDDPSAVNAGVVDTRWSPAAPAPAPLSRRESSESLRSAAARYVPISSGVVLTSAELLGLPGAVHLLQTVPLTGASTEALLLGLGGGVAAGVVNLGAASTDHATARQWTNAMGAGGAAFGVLDVGLRAVHAPAVLPAGAGVAAAVLLGSAGVVAVSTHPWGRPQTATAADAHRAKVLRRVGTCSLTAGTAGALATGVANVAGIHPPDAGLITFLAIGGTAASVVPLVAARTAQRRIDRSAGVAGL